MALFATATSRCKSQGSKFARSILNAPVAKKRPVHFECCNPILNVKKMGISVPFHTGLPGFKNADWGGEEFTCVNRDASGIYLCQGKGKAWVEDARRLHGEYAAKGVKIRMEPTNFHWALEFQVEDADGNVPRFGSEPD